MIQKRVPQPITRARKTASLSVRIPEELNGRIATHAARQRLSVTVSVERLLDEALRTHEFPGIAFRWAPTGERQPFIIGTGLSVWELYHMWDEHGGDVALLHKNFPHVPPPMVHAAVAYWKKYRREEPPGFWTSEPRREGKHAPRARI
ncbi:MAG: hypothetical protein HYY16_07320 [Planctomycetes bacterium]|nr:hypothetical protein [Planctomycetota bacterium]